MGAWAQCRLQGLNFEARETREALGLGFANQNKLEDQLAQRF
jgi:hypothetical protein